MDINEATTIIGRVLKEHRALDRLHEVLEVAQKYAAFEGEAEQRRAQLVAERAVREEEHATWLQAFTVRRTTAEADLKAFEQSIVEKRTVAENRLRHAQGEAEGKIAGLAVEVRQAEQVTASHLAALKRQAAADEQAHQQRVVERTAELERLQDQVRAAKDEIAALRSRLGG